MTGLLEPLVRALVLAIELPLITVRVVSLMIRLLTPVDKTMSSVTRPSAPAMV